MDEDKEADDSYVGRPNILTFHVWIRHEISETYSYVSQQKCIDLIETGDSIVVLRVKWLVGLNESHIDDRKEGLDTELEPELLLELDNAVREYYLTKEEDDRE